MIQLTGKRYAVTGSAGFIGGHLVDEIRRQGKDVFEYDIKTGVDIAELSPVDFKGIDVVFHEACSKCTFCRDEPYKDLMVNAWGAFNVFYMARLAGVKKVVHAATGSINNGAPKSFYGVSKQAGESYLRALAEYYPGFRWTSLRYHHVFGTRQDGSDKGGVVPIFIRQALAGGPITVDGDGLQHRLFTSVKDVVAANLLCAENELADNQVFNVMSDVSISILDLAHMVSELAGGVPIVHREAKKGDIRTFHKDNEPLKAIGLTYDNDFQRLLKETFEWYKAHGTSRA